MNCVTGVRFSAPQTNIYTPLWKFKQASFIQVADQADLASIYSSNEYASGTNERRVGAAQSSRSLYPHQINRPPSTSLDAVSRSRRCNPRKSLPAWNRKNLDAEGDRRLLGNSHSLTLTKEFLGERQRPSPPRQRLQYTNTILPRSEFWTWTTYHWCISTVPYVAAMTRSPHRPHHQHQYD